MDDSVLFLHSASALVTLRRITHRYFVSLVILRTATLCIVPEIGGFHEYIRIGWGGGEAPMTVGANRGPVVGGWGGPLGECRMDVRMVPTRYVPA